MKRGFGGITRPLLPAMLSVANPNAGQEATPIPESISIPTTSPDVEPMEHTYEQHLPTLPHEPATQTLRMEDLLLLVPTFLTKVDALETELKQSKETMGKAIIKLVKKVKKLETALKKRRVVLSDSGDEVMAKDKSGGHETPNEGTYTGDMDISPQGLEAAETLAETLSQIKSKKITDKAEERRRLQRITPSRTVTYSRRSAEKTPVKDKGKAIMTKPELEMKSKRQLEEERLTEEQQRAIDEEQSAKIDWNDPSVIMYHAQLMKPKSVAQARRNMIKYMKNQRNYKIKDFKVMSYNEIRPIFEKVRNFNHTEHVLPEQVKKTEQDKLNQVEKEVAKKPGVKRKKSIPRK
ncbi:hypothetical protein Tco_1479342, partial [Tanacetum coccineum]